MSAAQPLIGVVMGSSSDWEIMQHAAEILPSSAWPSRRRWCRRTACRTTCSATRKAPAAAACARSSPVPAAPPICRACWLPRPSRPGLPVVHEHVDRAVAVARDEVRGVGRERDEAPVGVRRGFIAVRVTLAAARVDAHARHVAAVPDPVCVEIRLIGILQRRAVVTRVRHAVGVVVGLAGVALPVGIRVALSCVGVERAVVGVPADAVAVGVVGRIARTGVAIVPDPVPICVDRLAGIERESVAEVARCVPICVRLEGYYMSPVTETFSKFKDYIKGLVVLRMHGTDRHRIEKIANDNWNQIYSNRDKEISSLVEMIKEMQKTEVDLFVNVNNHFEGSAPLTIEKIKNNLI